MTTVFLTTSYPAFPGDPSGHFVETEARLVARRGGAVVVVTGGGTGAIDETTDGIRVWRGPDYGALGWPGVQARIRERPTRILGAAAWVHAARAFVRGLRGVDRIVAHWAVPSAFPIASGLGIPVEVVSHGGDVRLLQALPSPVRAALLARLFRDVERWRFVSASLRDDLLGALSSEQRARLEAIAYVSPAAIELPDVRERSRALREAQGGVRLLVCVGRLVPSKRFEDALAHAAAGAKGARVVVVGDGPERPALEAQAERLGLDARFVGRAPREEALAWIGAADALLHASQTEGRSTVVREAEALGIPVWLVSPP